jgi:hypothetical protein
MRRKWNRDNIKTAIMGLFHSGDSLSYSSMVSDERALLQAATRYFGTWEAAVTATGLNYDSYRRHRKHDPTALVDAPIRRRRTRRRSRSIFD